MLLALIVLAGLAMPVAAQTPETRCGWFTNPSPANAWLTDKDGRWTIAMQGGHQADGDWPPAFGAGQWIAYDSRGSYGYGCACFKVTVDRATKRVRSITEAKGRPLAACRADKALADVEAGVR